MDFVPLSDKEKKEYYNRESRKDSEYITISIALIVAILVAFMLVAKLARWIGGV